MFHVEKAQVSENCHVTKKIESMFRDAPPVVIEKNRKPRPFCFYGKDEMNQLISLGDYVWPWKIKSCLQCF